MKVKEGTCLGPHEYKPCSRQETRALDGGGGGQGLVDMVRRQEVRSRVMSEQVYSQGVTDRRTYRTEGWSF